MFCISGSCRQTSVRSVINVVKRLDLHHIQKYRHLIYICSESGKGCTSQVEIWVHSFNPIESDRDAYKLTEPGKQYMSTNSLDKICPLTQSGSTTSRPYAMPPGLFTTTTDQQGIVQAMYNSNKNISTGSVYTSTN